MDIGILRPLPDLTLKIINALKICQRKRNEFINQIIEKLSFNKAPENYLIKDEVVLSIHRTLQTYFQLYQ